MSRRSASQSIVANPVLVGAVTTLVVIVAVFLAYNANNGLPFVPTRQLTVQLPGGANLVRGNEVREGGYRVGVIEEMNPVRLPGGSIGAELKVKLDQKIGELPSDTTFAIRPRSTLGLKYLEVNRGTAKSTFEDGATVEPSATRPPVDLDDLYNMFDEKTRAASRTNLKGFGNAFVARGGSLNQAIERFPSLFGSLEAVMRNLADPKTRLDRFFKELGDAARVVAPLSQTQAKLFTDMADTFEAFSRDPEALKATIEKSPSTLDVSTVSLRVQRPFLQETAAFSHDLRFAVADLRGALPSVNRALEVGGPVLRRSVTLNEDLQRAMRALRDLATAPTTNAALRGLTSTVATLNPMLKFLGPYQTVCNYWTYDWTILAEHLTEADPTGTAERALLNNTSRQKNSLSGENAYEPANGEEVQNGTPQFLHGQPYGAAIDGRGNADCEAGQRGYMRQLSSWVDRKFNIVTDPHTPGNQGPTFHGRARVPEGETFSREPEIGPQLDPILRTGE